MLRTSLNLLFMRLTRTKADVAHDELMSALRRIEDNARRTAFRVEFINEDLRSKIEEARKVVRNGHNKRPEKRAP